VRFDLRDPADRRVLQAVSALAYDDRMPRSGPVVVAIDGPRGAGKTILGDALAGHLPAAVVHMDELYPGWDGLAEAVELVTELVLEPLSRGEPAAYRRWDWARAAWGKTIEVRPGPFLVVEGCGSSVLPAGRHAAVRVWVDADRDVRMRRGIERDGETFRPHWERWARYEDALFTADRTRERAHVVVDTSALD